ncbi:ABC transporter permease [Treponema pectinovorum]|uniref:ABC transporter permease n=1 Tax=Treponema pectinovorum TaxID=164 RepID=UPI0011F27B90|nr:iron ABC transporter permease [Treponema pectinovorum]
MKRESELFKSKIGVALAALGLWLFFLLFVIVPVLFVFFSAKAEDFKTVFTSTSFYQVLKNTGLECLCSTFLSVFFGYIYAYAIVRGNLPLKKIFAAIPLIHMVTPPFIGGLSFILLFGRQGFITKTVLGLDISLYGFFGILLSQVLCFFPIAYLICRQTLEGINPKLEQAARSLGAKRLKIFLTITLPLSFAGILSSFLFIAVSVLSDFGNPLIVGGRFKVLAVEIYTQLTGWLNSGVSAVLGLVLLLPSVALFLAQNYLFNKNEKKLATVGAKAGFEPKIDVSPFARFCLTIFCSFLSILILAQFLSVVAGSFQKLWGIDKSFTLMHIKSVFSFASSLANSLLFSFIAALLSTSIAALTAYLTHRVKLPFSAALDCICQLPSAIPGTLFGLSLAYFANFVRFEWSAFLIVIAMTVSYLPFSYRICSSTFARLSFNLDEASRSLGAGRFKVLSSVILPLSVGGLFSSFVYDFVRGVGTLSSVIFLIGFNTSLASVKILNLAEQGDWGKSASLALVLTLITFIILFVGRKVSQKFEANIYE